MSINLGYTVFLDDVRRDGAIEFVRLSPPGLLVLFFMCWKARNLRILEKAYCLDLVVILGMIYVNF